MGRSVKPSLKSVKLAPSSSDRANHEATPAPPVGVWPPRASSTTVPWLLPATASQLSPPGLAVPVISVGLTGTCWTGGAAPRKGRMLQTTPPTPTGSGMGSAPVTGDVLAPAAG